MASADNLVVWLKRFQWPRGLRAAISVGGALLVSQALGLPPAAAAFGAFNTLLVDNGGPYRPRSNNMLTAMLGGAFALMLGELIPDRIAVIVVATMIVAFTVTFARALSTAASSASVLILVSYFAGLGSTTRTPRAAAMGAGLVIAGGLWSMIVSLFFWTIDVFRPARLSVAQCYRSMALFTAALSHAVGAEAENPDPGFTWRHDQRVRLEAARAALSSTPARVPSRTVRAHNLTVLLETSDMLLARTMRLSELKATAARLRLSASFALAGDLTHWLAGAEEAIATALFQRPADAAASFAHEGSQRLEYINRRKQLLAERDLALAQDDSLYAHLLREERDALLELEIAFDAVRALWTGIERPPSNLIRLPISERTPGWQDTLRANWTLESAAMRHALRLMVVGTVDVVVMHLIHINHGFWLPMTSIILMQPYSAGTVRKSVQRVTGTVAGGILAALLAVLISTPLAMLSVVTVLASLTVATFAIDYAIYALFLTPTFVLLSLPHAHDWRYALVRIGTTLTGALIAVTAMRLLWPERAELELGHLLRRGSAAAGAYVEAMLRFWQVLPEDRRVAERELLAPARRACGLASNDAEEAVDRVMQEPAFGRRVAAETILRQESLTFVTYLRRLTQSITTLALVGADSSDNRARLEPIAARLARLATESRVSTSFYKDEEEPARIDLAEEQMQRIERQTLVLERAAARLWMVAPDLETLATPEQEQREAADNERSRQPQP